MDSTAEKPARRTGQSGDKIELAASQLNDNERAVVGALYEDMNPLSIVALATVAFPSQPPSRASSWARNSLRRLVRGDWIEKMGRGTYALTEKGRAGYLSEQPTTAQA